MKLTIHTTTTTGLRETNQDRAFAAQCRLFGQNAAVAAVADGMGGHKEGDKAAEIAAATVKEYTESIFPSLPGSQAELREAIRRMFQEANRRIWEYARQNNCEGMGTTLVFAVVMEGRYLVANSGDSRCYYVNNYECRQLTEDHSRVQELVRKGAMTPEAAKRSPYRNQLTNSLGEPNDIQVDIFPENDLWGIIDEDCCLLLCSDGLHGDVDEETMSRQLHGTKTLAQACENLMSLAIRNGSTDNVTIAVAEAGRLARDPKKQPALPTASAVVQQRKHGPTAPAVTPTPASAAPRWRQVALYAVFALIGALLATGVVIGQQEIQQAITWVGNLWPGGNGAEDTTKPATPVEPSPRGKSPVPDRHPTAPPAEPENKATAAAVQELIGELAPSPPKEKKLRRQTNPRSGKDHPNKQR